MRKGGFTLIELLVVISIIALLSSVVLASLNAARDKARVGAGKQFASQVEHAAGDSAVGIWDFDECSGTAVGDRSGFGNSGVLTNGPTWQTDTPSGSGCAISFDGSNDHVVIADSASLDLSNNFTVSLWVKLRSAPNGHGFILKGDSAVSGAGLSYGWGGNGFQFIGWNSCNAPAVPQTGNDLNKWNHLVGVVSGGARTLYVNGVAGGTSANCGTSSWNNSQPLRIGVGSSSYADALIDEVRVYDKTLTATEVGKIYAESAPRYRVADR